MKGYIYTMYPGADPGAGWTMTDPIFGKKPTMGACMPNIRRTVIEDDYIFSISGRAGNVKQYVVGGFQVQEKIDAFAAYKRFPENRLTKEEDGTLRGNIIIDKHGNQLPIDYHSNFEKRLDNYIVGYNAVSFSKEKEIENARRETLAILSSLFGKEGNSVSEIIGRWRKMDKHQIDDLLHWFKNIQTQDND